MKKASAFTLAIPLAFTLTACGNQEEEPEAKTSNAPINEQLTDPSEITFVETDFDYYDPANYDAIACSNPHVNNVNGTDYTINSVAYNYGEDGGREAHWFIAPRQPRNSSAEYAIIFPDAQTLIYDATAISADWNLYRLDRNERIDAMPSDATWAPSSAITMVTVPIPPEMAEELGEPLRMTATVNGQFIGECEL